MNGSYDEDLTKNPFFANLQKEHPDLIENCISDNWIVCVPRIGSLDSSEFTLNDFLSHILVPDEELPATHFLTLTEKSIIANGGSLTVQIEEGEASPEVRILFDETFYTEDNLKYKIWCIETPLCLSKRSTASSYATLETLKDCIDFLWAENAGRRIFETIDNHVKCFKEKYSKDDESSLGEIRNKVNSLYSKCLHATFKNFKSNSCQYARRNVKLAVETYMYHGIYEEIFESISTRTASEDAELNKIIRNISDVQLKDLEIDAKFAPLVPLARRNLSRVQSYGTILGKVNCVKSTIDSLNKSADSFLTTDELLPLLIFLVIKSGLPNWYAHLNFMRHFRLSVDCNVQSDEASYLISTLEAVIEHIKSGVSIDSSSRDESAEKPETGLDYLFRQVRLSNCDTVKRILDKSDKRMPCQSKTTTTTLSIEEIFDENTDYKTKLCHPLCTCVKCVRDGPNVFSRDDRGLTLLHTASKNGDPRMIDLVLEYGGDVNALDYNGSTPLHFAAGKGHQNALLLLLHAGATINAENMDKNTPLHLATNNGHDSCVKALVYFAEYCNMKLDIDLENDNGDTCLHLASKWGYEGIVRLLLEYGADPWRCNRKGRSPIDVAHNGLVSKLLSTHFSPGLNDYVNVINIKKNVAKIMESNCAEPKYVLLDMDDDRNARGKKPKSIKAIGEIERLFRAIAYGDVKLACFYMNVPPLNRDDSDSRNGNMCHPLCSCEKCASENGDMLEASSSSSSSGRLFDINSRDSGGNTALHVAAQHGHVDICKILLRNGAVVDGRNATSSTPLHLSAKCGCLTVVNLLIEAGANVNTKDFQGNTPLHLACSTGCVDVVRSLLNTNNIIITPNTFGKTHLQVARDCLHLPIVHLLENDRC